MSRDETWRDLTSLRKRAEEMIWADRPLSLEPMSPEEAGRTLQELRVHQIELQMQNEELRRAQVELDAARARYFDLYDLAPVGYITVSKKGLILEANLTASRLLGVQRGALVKRRLASFVIPDGRGHLLPAAQTAPRNGPAAGLRSTNGAARRRPVLGTHRGCEGRRRRGCAGLPGRNQRHHGAQTRGRSNPAVRPAAALLRCHHRVAARWRH